MAHSRPALASVSRGFKRLLGPLSTCSRFRARGFRVFLAHSRPALASVSEVPEVSELPGPRSTCFRSPSRSYRQRFHRSLAPLSTCSRLLVGRVQVLCQRFHVATRHLGGPLLPFSYAPHRSWASSRTFSLISTLSLIWHECVLLATTLATLASGRSLDRLEES